MTIEADNKYQKQIKDIFAEIRQEESFLMNFIKQNYPSSQQDFMYHLNSLEQSLLIESGSGYDFVNQKHAYKVAKALFRLNKDSSINANGNIVDQIAFNKNVRRFIEAVEDIAPYYKHPAFICAALVIAATIAILALFFTIEPMLCFVAFLWSLPVMTGPGALIEESIEQANKSTSKGIAESVHRFFTFNEEALKENRQIRSEDESTISPPPYEENPPPYEEIPKFGC